MDRDDLLARATGYPYPAPDWSFLFDAGHVRRYHTIGRDPLADSEVLVDGRPVPVSERAGHTSPLAARIAVLAYGSNRSPIQLYTKFAGLGAAAVFPVVQCWLSDWDVVYGSHFARYGAIPAVLHPRPGVRVRISVMWLDDRQLARMHGTELSAVGYGFARLDAPVHIADNGRSVAAPHAYLCAHGCLGRDGMPVALADVAAEGRDGPVEDEATLLAGVRARLAPDMTLVDFLSDLVSSEARRRARIAQLRADALPFAAADVTWCLDRPAMPSTGGRPP